MCCDNDFFLPRHSMKQMLCRCMKKTRYCIYVYTCTIHVDREKRQKKREREGDKEERVVLCLDVRRALFHKRPLESATGKIIKGLAPIFLEHLVLKQNVSSVSSMRIARILEGFCLLHEHNKHKRHQC